MKLSAGTSQELQQGQARNCLLQDFSFLLFCFMWHLSLKHDIAVLGAPLPRRPPRSVDALQTSHASGCAPSCQGNGTAQVLSSGYSKGLRVSIFAVFPCTHRVALLSCIAGRTQIPLAGVCLAKPTAGCLISRAGYLS